MDQDLFEKMQEKLRAEKKKESQSRPSSRKTYKNTKEQPLRPKKAATKKKQGKRR